MHDQQPDPQVAIPTPTAPPAIHRCQWCSAAAVTDREVSPGVNAWVCGEHLLMIVRNEETAALWRRHAAQTRSLTHPDPVKKAKAEAQLTAIETRLAELDERVESRLPAPPKTSSKGPTQNERVHKALKVAGRRGLTRLDFEESPIIDGGPPLLRVASRIEELKNKHGVNIVSARQGGPGRCARYWLAENAPAMQSERRAA